MQNLLPRCHSEGMIRIKWQRVSVNPGPGFDGLFAIRQRLLCAES